MAQKSAPLHEEAVGENARTARYLASRKGIGDFSKFVVDGIETDGDKAIAETVYLYRQTAEINQDQADALIKKVIPNLNPDNAKRLQYFAAAGGEEFVRAWFYQWEIRELTEYNQEQGTPNSIQAKQYDYADWPYPVYQKTKLRAGNNIDWTPMFGDRIKSSRPAIDD